MRIQLTQVMYVPSADGKILSLKVLDKKVFERQIFRGSVWIMRGEETYVEAPLGNELYEVTMNVVPSQNTVMTAVKRDNPSTDLYMWH